MWNKQTSRDFLTSSLIANGTSIAHGLPLVRQFCDRDCLVQLEMRLFCAFARIVTAKIIGFTNVQSLF